MVTIGRITDEGVENLGSRLGSYYKGGPTLVEITEDSIYNYAVDNGDANPLYVDPDYAARSRFGGLIAPPAIVDVIKHYTAGMVGGLPGVHQFHSGNDITFYRPIRLGDRIGTVYRPYKMSEKQGRFAGRMISIDVIIWYFNQRGEVVAKAHGPCFRVERRQARERGKYKEVEKTRYTEAELQTIWDAYDREELRGDTPRYWEDVNVGDDLPTIVRGPLRIGEIAFRSVYGGGRLGGAGALAEGAHIYHLNEYRKRAGFAETSETGVDDHPHRGHWEDQFARFIGVPGALRRRGNADALDEHVLDQLDRRSRLAQARLERVPPLQRRGGRELDPRQDHEEMERGVRAPRRGRALDREPARRCQHAGRGHRGAALQGP